MGELRWVLLGIGALLIICVYLWGRGWLQLLVPKRTLGRRRGWLPAGDKPFDVEAPSGRDAVGAASGRDLSHPAEQGFASASADAMEKAEPELAQGEEFGDERDFATEPAVSRADTKPERIITVRFVPKDSKLNTETAALALRAAGLQHGRYGIFHHLGEPATGDPWFSVASLTEPGSFDLTKPASAIAGMSFFMVLPAPGDPVACFDLMVSTARQLALDLNAELHDDRGSSWSIQRERYVREEIIEYRHQHDRV